jgi:hypothetical protein
MKNYKLSYHLRSYIKQELYDYNRNKQILKDLSIKESTQITTKTLLILTKKVNSIENVYNNLNENDQEIFNIIFKKGCNQLYAKTYYNITKDMYYNAMNKIIYLVAQEYELI